MKARWQFRVVPVLVLCVLWNPVAAEELGFPKGCVELQKVPPESETVLSETYSSRDSVLFRLFPTSGKDANSDSPRFVAWDTETGKWLARRSAPSLAHEWKFSPDGKLLAVPVHGFARIVQLWEVGAKDQQGVPQLRLLTELRTKLTPLKQGQPDPNPPWVPYLKVAWTPDSKTLIVRYNYHRNTTESQILFWSFTDKPSVLADQNEDDRGAKAWKPWAKLEFEDSVEFAVSPDNRTLGVIEHFLRPPNGYFFDLQTAQPREKFDFDRNRDLKDPNVGDAGNYIPRFSPDSKTLAVHGHRYFTLWKTDPPAPRVNMLRRDFSEIMGSSHCFAFTSDSRWLLTCNIARNEDVTRRKGGLVQVRDAQTGDVRHEVSFPEQLGLLYRISDLTDHRVVLRFWSRKGYRQFLWHADDLLRYAVEHGAPPR